MVKIYDSYIDPEEYAREREEAARVRAEIAAEMAELKRAQAQELVQAQAEFDAVPSYVERFKDGRAVFYPIFPDKDEEDEE